MVDQTVWTGVNFFLDNYVGARQDDTFVVVYNSDTHSYAACIGVALEVRNIRATKVWMIPLVDVDFPARLNAALPHPSGLHGRLIVLTLELSTMSHDDVIRAQTRKYEQDQLVVYRIISACDELFSKTLMVAPEALSALNTGILESFMGASQLQIKTEGGTKLNISLDSKKHRWVSNRGVWRPGNFVILPPGEVATFPATIEGIFVADFAFNVNMLTDRDARLSSCPVTVYIKDNKAVEYQCSDKEVLQFLTECFSTYCAHIVGELGFGTNPMVRSPIRLNSHINERHPGVHLGFGSSNQSPSVVGYNCDIHLDLIAAGGQVWIDDLPTPVDMQNIRPSHNAHPGSTRDEDASSGGLICDLDVDDCCGILTSDGIRLFSLNG